MSNVTALYYRRVCCFRQGELWMEDSNFTNLSITGDVPTIFNVTLTECLLRCLAYDTCSTIFYHQELQACNVCLQPCARTLVPYPGFRCFRSRKSKFLSIFNCCTIIYTVKKDYAHYTK